MVIKTKLIFETEISLQSSHEANSGRFLCAILYYPL